MRLRALVERAQGRLALLRLRRAASVRIAPDAFVATGRISSQPGCSLTVGARSIVEATIDLERAGAALEVGENSYLGGSLFKVASRIRIGSDVEVAWNCTVVDHDWESLAFEHRRVDMRGWYREPKDWTHVKVAPVRIDDRALISFNAIILKGVHIGEGAVVGAGSVVTHDVEPYAVVAGSPARVIRRLDGVAVART